MNKQGLLQLVGKEWYDNILAKVLTPEVEFEIDGVRALYGKTIVYPEAKDVWKAFELCLFSKLKVVILAQDPYFNGEATGLCFEVKDGFKITPSFKQLAEAYNESCPNTFNTDILDGKLGCWAKQGVLLLNASLTVEAGKPNSHSKYWEKFTKNLIQELKKYDDELCIITIGKPASDIVHKDYINVLRIEHPAYASRQGRKWNYQNFFKEVNERLKILNKQEIEW